MRFRYGPGLFQKRSGSYVCGVFAMMSLAVVLQTLWLFAGGVHAIVATMPWRYVSSDSESEEEEHLLSFVTICSLYIYVVSTRTST